MKIIENENTSVVGSIIWLRVGGCLSEIEFVGLATNRRLRSMFILSFEKPLYA